MTRRARILGILALAVPACVVLAGKSTGVLATGVHTLNGVTVELLELKRDSPTEVTARWRYRNDSGETRRLTSDATGAVDPYRLALNSYLLEGQTKYPVARDSRDEPTCSRNGRPNEFTVIYPKSSITVWARYAVPESVATVTVVIENVPPFAGIPIR